jgi:hypothetical protein
MEPTYNRKLLITDQDIIDMDDLKRAANDLMVTSTKTTNYDFQ